MPRTAAHKPDPPSGTERDEGMVRMSMAIPAMERSSLTKEAFDPPPALPCSGRCGHCDIHPCQLHAPI